MTQKNQIVEGKNWKLGYGGGRVLYVSFVVSDGD